MRVDPLVNTIAQENNMTIVNLSEALIFHQGFDNYLRKRRKIDYDDFYYNIRYIKEKVDGSLKANIHIMNYTREV